MSETCVKAQCQMTAECKRGDCLFLLRDRFNFKPPKNPIKDFTEEQREKLIAQGISTTHYPSFRAYGGPDAIYIECEDVIL